MLPTAEFLVLLAETAAGKYKENSQFFNEDLYLPLYLPLYMIRTLLVFFSYYNVYCIIIIIIILIRNFIE